MTIGPQVKSHTMLAFCYASGEIAFGSRCPSGALPILRGPRTDLIEFIEGVCRHGYRTELVDGRPTKIKGTETLLVPGVPEAADQNEALEKLQAFIAWIAPQAEKRGLRR